MFLKEHEPPNIIPDMDNFNEEKKISSNVCCY
jgi:hypothetical protein